MIAGHDRRSHCRPALGGAGIGDDLRPENRQYLKCAKEHADETFSLTQLDPLNTPVWFICPCSFAHLRKNTTENFAPRESRLALIVGSRSWWQTKAASFLLAPRPLECLVTGNLATKPRIFDRYSPRFCAPVECHGPVHVAIDGGRHGRHYLLTSVCHPYLFVGKM